MIVAKEIKEAEKRKSTKEKKLVEHWNEVLQLEGLGELKGTYVSKKDFWRLDISRRTKHSN